MLIEASASQKSFERKHGDTDGDGSNDTHASKTDPDARCARRNGARP